MFPTTGLLAYYKTDSNSNDSTTNAYNGTDTNTPTYTSGKISNALTMSAASSQYVSIPQGAWNYGSNTMTFNVWIKYSSTSTTTRGILMTSRTSQGMNIYSNGGAIQFDKPNVVSLGYTWTIDTNWHMWTFVSDGSGMRIYLDGNSTPVASNANTTNWTAPSTDLTTIGGYRSSNVLQSGWYFEGQVDEIGFWSTALSTADIATVWNGGTGLTYTPASSTVYTPDNRMYFM